MKIRMNFGIVKTILVIFVIVGGLAIIGLDIAMLLDAPGMTTASPAVAGASMAAAIVICVLALLVTINCYYKFKDNHYVAVYGVFVDKVPYDKIVCLKQSTTTNELFVVVKVVGDKKYLPDNEQDMAYRINVAPNRVDAFVYALKDKRGDIAVEFFTPEKKEK